jgi:hypothetical protein
MEEEKMVPIGLLRELLLAAAEGAITLDNGNGEAVECSISDEEISFLRGFIKLHPDVQVRNVMLMELERIDFGGENDNV